VNHSALNTEDMMLFEASVFVHNISAIIYYEWLKWAIYGCP